MLYSWQRKTESGAWDYVRKTVSEGANGIISFDIRRSWPGLTIKSRRLPSFCQSCSSKIHEQRTNLDCYNKSKISSLLSLLFLLETMNWLEVRCLQLL
jgi:hypothetical protein